MLLSPSASHTALAIALTASAALVAQAMVSYRLVGGPGEMLWVLAGYFTVLTNGLVAVSFMLMRARGKALSARWLGGLTLWIIVVGIVYHLLLARLWAPVGLAWWADQGLHSAVPVLTTLWWIAFAPKARLTRRDAALWLAWPLIYLLYAMIRGAFTGLYPYPFIDLGQIGPGAVMLNTLGLLAGFYLGGLALIWLARRTTR